MKPYLYVPFFLLSFTPWISSAEALLMGLVLSLGLNIPLPKPWSAWGKKLLQISIVILGFSMAPEAVWKAGTHGVFLTAASLFLTLTAGYLLARALRMQGKIPTLITVGTAICGGSAIAAVGPAINAGEEDMAVSLAVVFLLNAVALLVFPPIGHWFEISPQVFGSVAAIAIHDTSSVVGAATKYSELSVPIAITIKLTRALWIIPLTLGFSYFARREAKGGASSKFPWFILLFVGAVLFRLAVPQLETFYSLCGHVGKAALKGAIFLASAQMTRAGIKRVGMKPITQAVVLWILVIIGTLLAAKAGLLNPI